MPRCKDPALTYLNQLGYNVVRLPREGIAPLDVLGRDAKALDRLGHLRSIWTSDEPEPPVQPVDAAGVVGEKTDHLKLSVGLKLLGNILRAMTGQDASVKAAYERARTVQFTFTDVQAEGIDPFEVGRYIAAGDLDAGNPFVDRYFFGDEAETYVITEVLKSNKVTVTARDKQKTEVAVEVPVVQQAVGGDVEVKAANAQATDITYAGPTMLVFGFKVFGLAFVDGAWRVHGAAPSGDLAFSLDDAQEPLLLGSSGLLGLG